ncbi:MAG TPA: MlaD family protein [Candidatus Sulfopaludibacter sp.]|nr:MlaD family protein [Candidatus Sulfopaludibacter sp.]
MALQDLTPQLRTRLSRMERAMGWFVFVATALLLFGFGYYIYHTAERKGWFVVKAPFHTYLQSSAGLNVGDPVYMMGFPVGEITSIKPQKPYEPQNVRLEFEVRADYFRYLWSGGSYLKVNAADFLGKRQLEVTRGTNGYEMVVTQPVSVKTVDELKQLVAEEPGQWQLAQDVFDADSNLVFGAYTMLDDSNLQVLAGMNLVSNTLYAYNNTVNRKHIVASWDGRYHHYKIFTPGDDTAWIHAVESPLVSDQLQAMILQVQQALPNVLALTNKLAAVLDHAADATSNLNVAVVEVRPLLTNFAMLSSQLREPGGLGVWMLGTNGAQQTQSVVADVDTNLLLLSLTLDHLADITSNLNAQVQANTNMLGVVSKTVGDADDFVQGLKRHWLFRSAFKKENRGDTNAATPNSLSPRQR